MSDYELTVTVNPTYIVNGMPWKKLIASKQWEFLQFFIYETLKKHDIEYIMYPEFHKPPNFNLHAHAHCILNINMRKIDIVDILKRLNQIGLSFFRPIITNTKNWCTYIRKDFEELGMVYASPAYKYVYIDTSKIVDPHIIIKDISDGFLNPVEEDYEGDDESH